MTHRMDMCERHAMAECARAFGHSLIPIGTVLLTASLTIGIAQAQPTCPGSILSVAGQDTPHGKISCLEVSDFSIVLNDGAIVDSSDGSGIVLTGNGDLSITTNPENGYSRVVARSDETKTNLALAAIKFRGYFPGDKPGLLNIAVNDVWALGKGVDGISVDSHAGELRLSAAGLIQVAESAPAFGVFVDNKDPAAYPTSVHVNNVTSRANASALNLPVAALEIKASGKIDVSSAGLVHTKGNSNHGVRVRQDVNANTEGSITIMVNDVITEGHGSYGINAEALNSHVKGTTLEIDINGRVETSGWGAHALALSGANATINVRVASSGSITVNEPEGSWSDWFEREPLKSYAVIALKSGSTPVQSINLTNHGRISGDLWLESCIAPLFTNRGRFAPGQEIKLAKAACNSGSDSRTTGLLDNYGAISPGGENNIAETTMTGDLLQRDSAQLVYDVDWASVAGDLLSITGSASLNGSLAVNDLTLPSGFKEVAILNATAGITGLADLGVSDTLFLDYGIRQAQRDGLDTLFLSSELNLNIEGLNPNQRNVLAELANSSTNNDALNAVYSDLLYLNDIEELRGNLDGYGNEIAGAVMQSTYNATGRFPDALAHCDRPDAIQMEFGCGWVTGETVRATRERTWPQRGFSEDINGFATGLSFSPDASGLHASIGLSLDRTEVELDTFAEASGDNLFGEAVLGVITGSIEYAVAVSAGSGKFDIHRTLPSDDVPLASKGKLANRFTTVKGSASWTGKFSGMSIRPGLVLGIVRISSRPYEESGAGDLSLNVHSAKASLAAASIGIEVEPEPKEISGYSVAPAFSVAYTEMSKNQIEVVSEFHGGTGSFLSTTSLLPKTIELELGANIASRAGRLAGSFGLQLAVTGDGKTYRKGLQGGLTYRF